MSTLEAALVDAINADPLRGEGDCKALSKIASASSRSWNCSVSQLDAGSTPLAGQVVRLRGKATLSTGARRRT